MFEMAAEMKAYRDFMYNPENNRNCENCPEDNGESAWPGNRLHCGQFTCWVDAHCKGED